MPLLRLFSRIRKKMPTITLTVDGKVYLTTNLLWCCKLNTLLCSGCKTVENLCFTTLAHNRNCTNRMRVKQAQAERTQPCRICVATYLNFIVYMRILKLHTGIVSLVVFLDYLYKYTVLLSCYKTLFNTAYTRLLQFLITNGTFLCI